MPISTVWMLKYVQQCYVKWFWTTSSLGAPVKAYTLIKILLWIKPSNFFLENACYSWCMHQTGLFSSASVVPWVNLPASCVAQRLLCHKVNLLSCVARRPQSKSTEMWSSAAAVIPQSKSTEMWSSAALFHHDLWYFRQWTNEHFSSVLFIRNWTWPAHSSATQATEINTLDQITGKVIDVSRTHIPLKVLMIPLKRVWNWEV